ncbi:hypothetical protein [Polynucleobacter antarcticus]|uniref:Uncharacterized protein n=1 Tax=Polynucleobacter antarcticus TaxID=1743162 RepID=A0A6M9PS01_9BURK|nr:hypothetical protein [Polynucleobacter antarcticus]QKM62652.1 hypothetical protein DCO16_06020 [Polynucleobacter antarcticus]
MQSHLSDNKQPTHKELVHSDFQIREVEAVVRRDAFTTIHVHVPPYETNILRNLFGRENVTVLERAQETTITPEQEYDRLCAKYGHEVVAKVFGEDDGDRLMEIVEGLMAEKRLKSNQEDATEQVPELGGESNQSQQSQPPEIKGAKKP